MMKAAGDSPLAIVLAAGRGSRMGADIPKPLVKLGDKTFLDHILYALRQAGISDISIVVGHGAEAVMQSVGNQYTYIFQPHPQGTGHAVMLASRCLNFRERDVLVFVGDAPLIRASSIQKLIRYHRENACACSFLSADFKQHFPYARVVRDSGGNFLRCVEERDASEAEKQITEYLSSHFIFEGNALQSLLPMLKPHPQTHELYLTDMTGIITRQGMKVGVCMTEDYRELVGINTPEELAMAGRFSQSHES